MMLAMEFPDKRAALIGAFLNRASVSVSSIGAANLPLFRDLMPSLTLTFHLLQRVTHESGGASTEIKTAETAAAWYAYLRNTLKSSTER